MRNPGGMAAMGVAAVILLLAQAVASGSEESVQLGWRVWSVAIVTIIGLTFSRSCLTHKGLWIEIQLHAVQVLMLTAIALAGASLLTKWVEGHWPSVDLLVIGAIAGVAGMTAGGALLVRLGAGARTRRLLLIYGADGLGISIARKLEVSQRDITVGGFLLGPHNDRREELAGHPILGAIEDVPVRLADGRAVDGVILAVPNMSLEEAQTIRRKLRSRSLDVFVATPTSLTPQEVAANVQLGSIECLMLGVHNLSIVRRAVKRMLDIVIAALALIFFSPVLITCAIAIKLESPGPVIYRQKRFTTGNRLFDCYKLRTMRMSKPDETGIILTQRNDRRVTRVGAFLRRTSLDELPQFVNVLQGHMSVVGPRPHPPGVKAGDRLYEDVVVDFADRYTVKPGITGWAQVNGLRGNTFTENMLQSRFQYDLEYIRHWSLSLEILIILKTLLGGFGGRNAF